MCLPRAHGRTEQPKLTELDIVRWFLRRGLDFTSGLRTRLLNYGSENPFTASHVVRSEFSKLPLVKAREVKGHSHPTAQALRSQANSFATSFAERLGRTRFDLQTSRANQRAGIKGRRDYYWGKDLVAEDQSDEIGDTDIVTMIDVDYYVDMPSRLANDPRIYLLYTTNPSTAAGCHNDSSHRFEGGQYVLDVAGGGTYRHPLWDYNHDSIMVTQKLFNYPLADVYYNVDRIGVAEHRELVLLTPTRVVKHPLIFGRLAHHRLQRLCPTADGFTVIRSKTRGPEMVSIAKDGGRLCANILATKLEALQNIHSLQKTPLGVGAVAREVKNEEQAAVLVSYIRANGPEKSAYVAPVEDAVRAYRFITEELGDPDAKCGITAFMSPILDRAAAPILDRGSEERAVKGRIKDVKPRELPADSFTEQCMGEFVQLLCGNTNLEPVSPDEVWAKQDRPSQQRILADAENLSSPDRRISSFIKKEAGELGKDPRIISTINGQDKLHYSRYTYALSAMMKDVPWYAFGLTPAQITERVVEVAAGAETLFMSDFSRMDGRVAEPLRHLERMVMFRLFPTHIEQLDDLMRSQYNLKAKLSLGTTYDTGTSRASGSPETSVFNTIASAFVSYCGHRRTKRGEAYMQPQEAWNNLGIYGGDDGFTPNADPRAQSRAAERVGQVLEGELLNRGDAGVNFLARYYSPDVWYGDGNSCSDIRRQLSKFHTTVRLPDSVSAADKLVEKARSFAATDAETPIIGDIIDKVLSLTDDIARIDGIGSWWSRYDRNVQYTNIRAEWMDDLFRKQVPDFTYDTFHSWLSSCTTLQEVLSAPLCEERPEPVPTKADYEVDGRTIRAK